MKHRKMFRGIAIAGIVLLGSVGIGIKAQQDKYTVKVPGGLAFSELRGHEDWQVVAISHSETVVASILANPAMIYAYQASVPGNGKPFPDGSKMVKIHWTPKQSAKAPSPTTVPGALQNVDFMEKDSKRFADSGGWAWAAFEYVAASDTLRPGTLSDRPPEANDAKCGFACHTIEKSKDYVFTGYGKRLAKTRAVWTRRASELSQALLRLHM
jgi:cytochrome P460